MYENNIPPYFKFCTRKTENEILKEYHDYLIKVFNLVIPKIIQKPISTMDM